MKKYLLLFFLLGFSAFAFRPCNYTENANAKTITEQVKKKVTKHNAASLADIVMLPLVNS